MNIFEKKIAKFAIEHGFLYKKYNLVTPPSPYKDAEFVFMNAMSRPVIYLGKAPQSLTGEVSLVRCIRRGSHADKISERHMTTFDMLGFSLITDRCKAIELTFSLIASVLSSKIQVSAKVHPNDSESILCLRNLNIDVMEDSSCYFNKPEKTNRSGYRVEFYATAANRISWELQNLILIDNINNEPIDYCIAQTGGSVERILALNNETYDVYKTSAYNLELIESRLHLQDENLARNLANLIRTIITILGSNIMPGERNKRERIFSDFCLRYAELCMSAGIQMEEMTQLLHNVLDSEKKWINPIIISKNHLAEFNLRFESLLEKALKKTDLLKSNDSKNIWCEVKSVTEERRFSEANDMFINQTPVVKITEATRVASSVFLKHLLISNNCRKVIYYMYGFFNGKFVLKIHKSKNHVVRLSPSLSKTEPSKPYEILAYRISGKTRAVHVVVIQIFDKIDLNDYVLSKKCSLLFDLSNLGINRYVLDNKYKVLKLFRNKLELC